MTSTGFLLSIAFSFLFATMHKPEPTSSAYTDKALSSYQDSCTL